MTSSLFVGSFIHATSNFPITDELDIVKDGVICVHNGKIVEIFTENIGKEELKKLINKYNIAEKDIHELKRSEFLIPGLIDTHIHAPQYGNCGLGLDLPLLKWLEKYTFPLEAKFADIEFAKKMYEQVVKRTLKWGTTTACYFATIHLEASKSLADIVEKYGQRALVGKVNMDKNTINETYVESTDRSIADTKAFVKYVLAKEKVLIKPIITPRFALTCTERLMKELAEIAKTNDLHIQTHVNENLDEVQYVKQLFPEQSDYVSVYDINGLLTSKTVLAHCIHMTPGEIEKVQSRDSAISHCPLSNIALQSGLCDIQSLGYKTNNQRSAIGLGTDASGGYSPSMLTAMRSAIETSKIRYIYSNKEKSEKEKNVLNYKDALYLATLSGAKALKMDKEIGSFEKGKCFDALRINLDASDSPVDASDNADLSELLQKFIMVGDDRNIVEVYVNGDEVKYKKCNS